MVHVATDRRNVIHSAFAVCGINDSLVLIFDSHSTCFSDDKASHDGNIRRFVRDNGRQPITKKTFDVLSNKNYRRATNAL